MPEPCRLPQAGKRIKPGSYSQIVPKQTSHPGGCLTHGVLGRNTTWGFQVICNCSKTHLTPQPA